MAGARVTIGLKERDLGLVEFMRRARAAAREKLVVKVGVLEESDEGGADHGGITTAELAAIHEFGAPQAGIPERSFIRSTWAAKRDEMRGFLKARAREVLLGKRTVEQALGLAGAKLAADIKKAITSGPGIPPPLAPATIARKGSDRPLVDTGRLVGAITWSVVRRR